MKKVSKTCEASLSLFTQSGLPSEQTRRDTQRGKAVEELGAVWGLCAGREREGTLGYLQVNKAPSSSLSAEEPIRETGPGTKLSIFP